MPLETDLSGAPYHDDFDEAKKFHKFLFKPETAVQVRELTGIQTMLQNQIERFGNNIFKRGTIIDGANFVFYDSYPYVKINDVQQDGDVAIPENYLNYFIKNEDGLIGRIIDHADGFESTNPDLKTVYVRYINSGSSFNDTAFSAGQVLTIYDSNNVISQMNIITPGSNYSNSDVAVTTPVLLANVNVGVFVAGDTITDPVSGSRGIVVSVVENTNNAPNIILGGSVSVNTTSANVTGSLTSFLSDFSNGDFITVYSNSTNWSSKKINVVSNNTFMNLTSNSNIAVVSAQYANTVDKTVFITYKPNNSDLSAEFAVANNWTFNIGQSLEVASSGALAQIKEIYGINAAGGVLTDSSGRIIDISMYNRGGGYSVVPYVSIKTTNGSGANLVAQNYLGQVTVSSLAGSIGSGYAFGITEGIVYQKGFFIKVDPQTIIVDKYSNSPDKVTVGFYTEEEIINANIDNSLFDNVIGDNALAPGADRLKLSANLVVRDLTVDIDDPDFFNLVEWSEGFPFKQNDRTFYNILGDEINSRTSELTGSVVIDQFLVNTTDTANSLNTASSFNVVVDPGIAYVNGARLQTITNYTINNDKAIETSYDLNNKLSVNYENYIRVKSLGGFFEFDRANTVDLYDTACNFLETPSKVATGNLTPAGTKIGTARIRNLMYEQGKVGSIDATYRAFVFDIQMDAGQNFSNVRAIASTAASPVLGIADVVLEPNSQGSANVAILHGNNNGLLFTSTYNSPLNSNNISYQFRTISTQVIANTGLLTISLVSTPTRQFPYDGILSDQQKSEIMIAPEANLVAYSALTGTVAVNATSANVIGTGTNFLGQVKPNQYIAVNTAIKRVVSVTNSTHMVLDSNSGVTSTGESFRYAWPAYVPIELQYNSNYVVQTVGANTNQLTINLGSTLNAVAAANVTVAFNVEQTSSAVTKTVNRNRFVKLSLANNVAATTGPWSLGIPDVFRLRNVYKGTSTVNVNSTNITSEFFIDHNQNLNYYNLSTLNQIEKSSIVLTSDDYLLIEFDAFTATAGLYTVNSYVTGNKGDRFIEDSKPLAGLTTTVNTLEIPEVFGNKGEYYDLINSVDFRPYVDATANLATSAATATINPSATISFSSTDRFFPVPGSIFKSDIEYFESRIDAIVLDGDRNIRVVNGNKGSTTPPKIPAQTMRINNVAVSVYPAIPNMISSKTKDILSTGVKSGLQANIRPIGRLITTTFNELDFSLSQPRNYTAQDIGSIDRRLRDVEYYQALTLAQSSIMDRMIPSSLASNIDRFKYGFFVDNYDDASYSEDNSPEYRATIENGLVGPSVATFNTVHTGRGITAAPYTEVQILSQGLATLDPVPPPPPPVVVPPIIIPPPIVEPPVVVPPITNYVGTMTIEPPTFKAQQFTNIIKHATGGNGLGGQAVAAPPKSGGKIICTAMNEAYGFGSFRNAIWIKHAEKLTKEHEIGYHKLVLPMIEFAYRNKNKDSFAAKTVRIILERIARKRTADLWKEKRGSMDFEGRVYRKIFEPICFIIGKAFSKKEIK